MNAAGRGDLKREYRRTTTLMAIPATLLYCFFFIVPVCMGIHYSVTDWNGVARTNNFVGLNERFFSAHIVAVGGVL